KHRDQFPSSCLLVTRIWKCFDIAAVVVITHRNGRGGFRQFSWRFRSRFISSGEWVKCNCCPSGRRAFSVGTGWRKNNSPATHAMDSTRWVLVAGANEGLSKEHEQSAESLGIMLGNAGYGLIAGRWSGVDPIVTQAFVDAVGDSYRDRLRQIETIGGP